MNKRNIQITKRQLDEMEEIMDSVNPENINLHSFQFKKQLNQKFWKNGTLDPAARERLLSIAQKFYDFLKVGWVKATDAVFVGSMASYNWSKYSDIDLHIIMDLSKVDDNVDLVKNYFTAKKNEWNNEHEMLTIYGYPVELYVQDVDEENASNGVYSLRQDRWVKFPEGGELQLNAELIKPQAAKLINTIDYYDKKFDEITSPNKMKLLRDKVHNLYDSIIEGRHDGLANEGESAPGNIVFKILRRTGHIGKLKNLKFKIYDRMTSLQQ